VLGALEEHGLLWKQDKVHPNVVTLVTGERLSSSWWSHPQGRRLFALLGELADHEDVLFAKLLDGKVTLVHRRLWPAFLAVASARDEWQTRGLSAGALRLLADVDEHGRKRAAGAAVKELELRLLVHAEEVHTESGRHEIELESWSAWARRRRCKPARSSAAARAELEAAVDALGAPRTVLPWPTEGAAVRARARRSARSSTGAKRSRRSGTR